MARGSPAGYSKKRQRARKPYKNKAKVVASFGCFDTNTAFEEWRQSSLVKPWWDIFVSKFLDTNLFRPDKQVDDFEDLYAWIKEGEKNGRRRFDKHMTSPNYEDATDWHAWLTHWLVKENKIDREGCFFGSRLENKAMFQTAYHYILFAKRERARALTRSKTTRSPKTKPKPTATRLAAPLPDESDTTQRDSQLGMAIVKWTKGQPSDLPSNATTTVVESFCGYKLDGFWQEIDRRFDLSTHKQRPTALVATNGMSFEDAQDQAAQSGAVLFSLETRGVSIERLHIGRGITSVEERGY